MGQDLGSFINLSTFSRSSHPRFLHDILEAEMGSVLFKHLQKSSPQVSQPRTQILAGPIALGCVVGVW